MEKDRKTRLVALGPEALADALLDLANRIDAVDDKVDVMIATPRENVKRFRSKLAGLKRRNRFVSWRESGDFAYELEMMLDELEKGVADPCTGAELVAAFFKIDRSVFERCDDSSGIIADVFRFRARKLFADYASRCPEKSFLVNLLYDLSQDDAYGIRGYLIDSASEYLSESAMRDLIEQFRSMSRSTPRKYKNRRLYDHVESLARQLKDAPLFEKTRKSHSNATDTHDVLDIAEVYLESDDAETALAWMEKIIPVEAFRADKADRLLLDIHTRLGDRDKMAEVAWRMFRRSRSKSGLERLSEVIGPDQKDAVMKSEISVILDDPAFRLSHASFLIDTGHMDEVETYLLDRAEQIDGSMYQFLIPLIDPLEAAGRRLCATLIIRALLDSILKRGYNKAYPHAVRYLNRLDVLANHITDWHNQIDHEAYKSDLREQHGRKTSFWSRYEK